MEKNAIWKLAEQGITTAIAECSIHADKSKLRTISLLKECIETLREFLPEKPLLFGEVLGEHFADAASSKRLDALPVLATAGANVDFRGSTNFTPLHSAIIADDEVVVRAIWSVGADVDAAYFGSEKSPVGTALQLAIERGSANMVELLLELDANPNIVAGKSRNAALHSVAKIGPSSKVALDKDAHKAKAVLLAKCCLQAGANPLQTNAQAETPLVTSVKDGGLDEVVHLLLGACSYPQDQLDAALCYAVRQERIRIIEALVQAGANANAQFHGRDLIELSPNIKPSTVEFVRSLMTAGAVGQSLTTSTLENLTTAARQRDASPL